MGLILAKRVRDFYDGIFNVGGNENTRHIFFAACRPHGSGRGRELGTPAAARQHFPAFCHLEFSNACSAGRNSCSKSLCTGSGTEDGSESPLNRGFPPGVISVLGDKAPHDWQPFYDRSMSTGS